MDPSPADPFDEPFAPPTDPVQSSAKADQRRETTGGVLGVGVGLLVAVGLLALLLMPLGGTLDAEARVHELFGDNALPFGLEVERAATLPTGDVVLQLQRGEEVHDGGPQEVLLVQYRSRSALSSLLAGGDDPKEKMPQWQRDPSFAWQAVLERDEIRWGEWRSNYARLRHFEEGGDWTESARVDLSQTKRPLALMAMWGPKQEVDKAQLIEILNRIEMLREEEG